MGENLAALGAKGIGLVEDRGDAALLGEWLIAASTSIIAIGTVWARIIPRTTMAIVPAGSFRKDIESKTSSAM